MTKDHDSHAQRLLRKVGWRLLPLVGFLYFTAFIDRVAIAYAASHGMNEDLGLTATMFGFASGIFYFGYILFEVPSNALLVRFGTRKWIVRILITWGAVQVLMAFVTSPELLYVGRFLLGLAEAGFAPGILYYLTVWFPARRLARINAIFFAVPALANVFGAFIGAGLVALNSAIGWSLEGWRFIILATGVLALLASLATFFWLTEKPEVARWLKPEQRVAWAQEVNATGASAHAKTGVGSYSAALKSKWTWLLGATYFAIPYSTNALTFFLPLIIAGLTEKYHLELGVVGTSAITGLPWAVAVAMLFVVSYLGDRTQRHGMWVAICMLTGVVGIGIANISNEPFVILAGLCLVAIGGTSPIAALFAMVPKYARGPARAAGMALVVALGTTGGFFGPYVTGFLSDLAGNYSAALIFMSVVLVAGALLALFVDRGLNRLGLRAPIGSPEHQTYP